jgi:ribosome-associated toxin RatA of RatAB toxin-antitoxin module
MKHLDGHASAVVRATPSTCFALLSDVERYPSWSGEFIREVLSVERDGDGRAQRAHVLVHVAQSPFAKDYGFDVAVRAELPHAVYLSRLPSNSSDRERLSLSWSLAEVQVEGHGTRIELELLASVSFLPEFLPLPGVGDLVAGTLLGLATDELGGSIAPAGASSSG